MIIEMIVLYSSHLFHLLVGKQSYLVLIVCPHVCLPLFLFIPYVCPPLDSCPQCDSLQGKLWFLIKVNPIW